jgi:hypothetical protein
MKMVFKVVEGAADEQGEGHGASTTQLPPIPVPTPAAFWSRFYNEARMPEVRLPEARDRYTHGKSFQQSSQLTYFSEDVRTSRSSDSSSFSLEKRDGSVDITIIANALSSGTTGLFQTHVCLLGLLLLLRYFWAKLIYAPWFSENYERFIQNIMSLFVHYLYIRIYLYYILNKYTITTYFLIFIYCVALSLYQRNVEERK